MLWPFESSTQTRTLTGSASLTGSPLGTSTTLVAHPLFMLANAIQETITQSWITFCIFAGGVSAQQMLDELEHCQQDLLDDHLGASTDFFFET